MPWDGMESSRSSESRVHHGWEGSINKSEERLVLHIYTLCHQQAVPLRWRLCASNGLSQPHNSIVTRINTARLVYTRCVSNVKPPPWSVLVICGHTEWTWPYSLCRY